MDVIVVNENIAPNNVFWSLLISSIYKSFKIKYVVNKGKKYMNFTNSWYNASVIRDKLEYEGIEISHKDYECT